MTDDPATKYSNVPMCLIAFSYQMSSKWPLLVVANRDEFYERPTRHSQFWPEFPHLLAGRDERAGGTWMGITKQGRFAAVTNVRGHAIPDQALSRGELPSQFLLNDTNSIEYLNSIKEQAHSYAGFNLLCGHIQPRGSSELYYFSNQAQSIEPLSPGHYSLSNAALNSPWPKSERIKTTISEFLAASENSDLLPDVQALFAAMADRTQAKDDELPSTGISIELERALSSPFIFAPDQGYGTRTTTVLLISQRGEVNWWEQAYQLSGNQELETSDFYQWRFNLQAVSG